MRGFCPSPISRRSMASHDMLSKKSSPPPSVASREAFEISGFLGLSWLASCSTHSKKGEAGRTEFKRRPEDLETRDCLLQSCCHTRLKLDFKIARQLLIVSYRSLKVTANVRTNVRAKIQARVRAPKKNANALCSSKLQSMPAARMRELTEGPSTPDSSNSTIGLRSRAGIHIASRTIRSHTVINIDGQSELQDARQRCSTGPLK